MASLLRLLICGLFFLLFPLAACVTGPKRENDGIAERLSGDNYRERANVLGVPIIERVKATTRIRGRLLLDGSPLQEPLRHQVLVLKRGERELLRTMSNAQGDFEFAGELPNGSYELELESARYVARSSLDVRKYEIDGVRLVARKKSESPTPGSAR